MSGQGQYKLSGEPAVEAVNVVKKYGSFTALHEISLSIAQNEFFTLLGPSGCGKTTLLRMIAGFEEVTEGAIFLAGQEIENLPPHKRSVNTVFQNYALFPHMTILQNIMFGLEMRGESKATAKQRAGEMLDLVHLSAQADRKPSQLSGGQQQRVALARALAPRPEVLLLDEPLSALDLKLRQAMRTELKSIQKQTGVTFIFVTHDQDEALTMSDRIAVMSAGYLQQLGTAQEIYEQPRNQFVADFIGETNLLEVDVVSIADGRAKCALPGGHEFMCAAVEGVSQGSKVHVSIRPERLSLQEQPEDAKTFPAIMGEAVYSGSNFDCSVTLRNGPELRLRIPNSGRSDAIVFAPGSEVHINPEAGAARLLID